MKRILLTTSLISLGFVSQAHAQSFAERVAAAMLENGYTDVEIEIEGGELTVAARRDDIEIETVYSTTTEEVLEHHAGYVDDDEDEDDHDDDHDGDDYEDEHEDDGDDDHDEDDADEADEDDDGDDDDDEGDNDGDDDEDDDNDDSGDDDADDA